MDIKIDNLTKSYDREIIKGLSIELKDHSAVAIIGKSGCGKSTLLRLISGIEQPDHGSIEISGVDINHDLRNYQKSIGFVFQKHNLFPHLSVLKNITLILEEAFEMDKKLAMDRSLKLLKRFHLSKEIHKKPSEISGGQAQRASIVRAIAPQPDLLFFDEPTASLDPILTYEVLDTIESLKKGGTKFLMVTHEMDFVRRSADYVVFLDDGKIIEQGPVAILEQPRTQLLRSFVTRVNKEAS
jgi:polar amino acid transport system ATP-binding protein